MTELFALKEVTEEGVAVLEITEKRKDPLFVAEHPFLQKSWKYISVTGVTKERKNLNHTLSVIKEDGDVQVAFEWGVGGRTLISDRLQQLKVRVIEFLEDNGYYAR